MFPPPNAAVRSTNFPHCAVVLPTAGHVQPSRPLTSYPRQREGIVLHLMCPLGRVVGVLVFMSTANVYVYPTAYICVCKVQW